MNATSIDELRGQAARDLMDQRLEQVRQILIGDHTRESAARFEALEARLKAFEASVAARLDEIREQVDALSAHQDEARRTAFEGLSQGVAALAEQIRAASRG